MVVKLRLPRPIEVLSAPSVTIVVNTAFPARPMVKPITVSYITYLVRGDVNYIWLLESCN